MPSSKDTESSGGVVCFQPQRYPAWGELPDDILRGGIGHLLMADPNLRGRARGLLRLACKPWNEACCELTQHLAPGPSTVDENLLRLATKLPNLTSLDLSRCHKLSPEAAALLQPLAGKLRSMGPGPLSLHCAPIAAAFSSLESLDLECPLDDTALQLWAPALPSLKVLKCLQPSTAEDQHFGVLLPLSTWRQLSRLEELTVPNTHLLLSEPMLHELHAMRTLDMSSAHLPPGALAALAVCAKLRILRLPMRGDVLTNEDLSELEECTQLVELVVPYGLHPNITMSAIRGLRRKLPETQVQVQLRASPMAFGWQLAKMACLLLLIAALPVRGVLAVAVELSAAAEKRVNEVAWVAAALLIAASSYLVDSVALLQFWLA